MMQTERRQSRASGPVSRANGLRWRFLAVVVTFAAALAVAGCAGSENDQPVSSSDASQQPPSSGPATAIVGVVTDEEDQPIAQVNVMVSKGTSPVREIAVLTGADGSYLWGVPAGTYTLQAHKDGYQDLSQEVVVKEGEHAELNFQLKKLP